MNRYKYEQVHARADLRDPPSRSHHPQALTPIRSAISSLFFTSCWLMECAPVPCYPPARLPGGMLPAGSAANGSEPAVLLPIEQSSHRICLAACATIEAGEKVQQKTDV